MATYNHEESIFDTQFVTIVNELRRSHKNQWIWWNGIVNNKQIRLKFYNLWNQLFKVDSIDYAGVSHKNICNWIDELRQPFDGERK